MRELIILVLCFVLYVVAVEVYEARVNAARQGQLAPQEQSFNYEAPEPPLNTEEGTTITTGLEEE